MERRRMRSSKRRYRVSKGEPDQVARTGFALRLPRAAKVARYTDDGRQILIVSRVARLDLRPVRSRWPQGREYICGGLSSSAA